ncbi:MAG TPA: ATP-binding protein [Rugosibacter sp.]
MSAKSSHSLRARLLWLLLVTIVVVAVVQSYSAYRTVLDETDAIFDYHMQQMVVALRPTLPLKQSREQPIRKGKETNGNFLIRIWTSNGARIFESAGSAALPPLAVLGFSDVKAHDGTIYRVLSVQIATQTVQVAQDITVRRAMARKIALRTIAPIALMTPVLMFLVFWVITHSLVPVARIRRQVAARQPSDLSSISEADLPDEISPLVKELNLLLKRVSNAFETQQHFVANAAHELRSPLTALKLQIQRLRQSGSAEEREVATTRLNAGIDRASRLVEQLLALAQQETIAASTVTPQLVSLTEVTRRTMTEIVATAQERHIDLGISHADAASVAGFPDALHILVRNLLDNAVKYSPEGGRIDVEVHAANGIVELSVDDSGPGIPAEHRTRVLDRFYRIHGAPQTMGSGLGLAIVKSIAGRHGAELTLEDSASLGGLRVVVRFPASHRD